jgi:GTP-binding protein
MSLTPVVAIVGRPNVGKSTLFNRLAGERLAVIHEAPGTTRDRLVARVTWDDSPFILVDTGGLVFGDSDDLAASVQAQVQAALADADVIVFVVDSAIGLHPQDSVVADLLRRQGKPVVLAVSKCESPVRELASAEFYRLGMGEPAAISAIHNQGIGDLMDRVIPLLPSPEEPQPPQEEAQAMRLALVGRPNVGKSSLLNAIVGEERAIVHEAPGTTRDAVDTSITYRGQPLVLVDTAGIRSPGRIVPGVEYYSSLRAFQAIERCDVAVLVMDATEMAAAQDTHIAGYIAESYRGMVFAVNKWDLAQERAVSTIQAVRQLRRRFPWAPWAPVQFTSAVTGAGVKEMLDTALEVYQARLRHVGQGELNRLVVEKVAEHEPPSRGARRLRIMKVIHASVNPPTFVFHVNDATLLHFSYRRYLQNALRSAFGFHGSPLRLDFKSVAERRGHDDRG